jgi:hypothetical protein
VKHVVEWLCMLRTKKHVLKAWNLLSLTQKKEYAKAYPKILTRIVGAHVPRDSFV